MPQFEDWDSAVNYVLLHLPPKYKKNEDFIKLCMNFGVLRLKALLEYNLSPNEAPLKSLTTLICSSQNDFKIEKQTDWIQVGTKDNKCRKLFWGIVAWPPLVTGLPRLHDNAASTDACRWSVVTNARRIYVKWIHFWKIVKKIRNWIIGLKFFSLESENSLLNVKKITALPTVSFLFYRLKMESFLYCLGYR